MEKAKINVTGTLIILIALLWLLPSVGEAATFTVPCPTASLQAAIDKAKPGDTLLVSGVCNENLFIGEGIHGIVLDGQGSATLNGPSAVLDTVGVEGARAITIKGFTITGGRVGIIVELSGTAKIDSNTIRNVGATGIVVAHHGFAQIVNNTIRVTQVPGSL